MQLNTERAIAALEKATKAKSKKASRKSPKAHRLSRTTGDSATTAIVVDLDAPKETAPSRKSRGRKASSETPKASKNNRSKAKATPPVSEEVTQAFSHRKGRKPANLEKVIKVLVEGNPRKEGTHGHKAFALYTPGMTVGAYFLAGGASNHFNWDLAHGFISIE